MKAIYAHRDICDCGHGVMDDSIPLGTVYEIDPPATCRLNYVCGGCGVTQWNIECFFVLPRPRSGQKRGGYLPAAIFEVPQLADRLAS